MKNRNVAVCLRMAAGLFSVLLFAQSVGCASGNATQQEAAQIQETTEAQETEETQSAESVEEDVHQETNEEAAQAGDKEYVYDFDALVNDDWKNSVMDVVNEKKYDDFSPVAKENLVIEDRIKDIFQNTDISSLSEDSDLYKILTFYNQILDPEWQETSAKKEIKEKLDRIDSVKSQDELYELFRDKFYGRYNQGMSRSVNFMGQTSTNSIYPQTINYAGKMSEDQSNAIRDYLILLGFSEDRANEIVANAVEMDDLIMSFFEGLPQDYNEGYVDKQDFRDKNVKYPLFDILEAQNALGMYKEIYCIISYPDFLDEYYSDENTLKIRDHMLCSAAISLSRLDEADGGKTYYTLFPSGTDEEFPEFLSYTCYNLAPDVFMQEYKNRYLDEKNIEAVQTMLEDIKTSMRSVIDSSDWLSVHGREMANHKIFYLKNYIGENGKKDDLSEVELSDDPMENFVAFKLSRYNFEDEQLSVKKGEEEQYGANFLVDNAFYYPYGNSIVVGDGCLEGESFEGDSSYEEKLGYLGSLLAHELSHAYDPQGSSFDYEGYYNPWMTDEEYEAYSEKTGKIEEFFDGIEVGEGIILDGKRVSCETFSDLMGVECCLKILEGMENPDYDAFFKAYARSYACYYTQDGLIKAVEDTHLPCKERINYVLGQFDQFYDTYEVDPESPYFIPEEKRLENFCK